MLLMYYYTYEVTVKNKMIRSTNYWVYIFGLQRIAMGMPVAAWKGSGVEVARGSKRLRNYVVEETDTEEEVETSDGSEIVCFIRNVNII